MSYYMGDFYAEGDPGFFGSIGKLVKGVSRVIPGVGTAVDIATGLASKFVDARHPKVRPPAPLLMPPGRPGFPGFAPGGRMGPIVPGGGLALGPGASVVPSPGMGQQHCYKMSPRGRRIRVNCRTGKAIRHMRVTNPKALRRAIRRANGFAKLARKVLHFTSPKAPKGRAIFKKRRKK